MKKLRTIVSVIAMIIAEIGATMNNAIGGAILFSMIAGIACIIYAIDNQEEQVNFRFIEMFGDPISNPMKWDIYRLEECLVRIDNGKSFICSDKPRNGGYPAILKLSAATYGDYRPNENKALLDESLFIESSEVHAGDLLFTSLNCQVKCNTTSKKTS